jgi:Flp pilus assembly protein TadG
MNSRLSDFLFCEDGAAAAEFAMFAVILAPLLLNLGDMGYYAYTRMEVENAAQNAAQAAWANCSASTPSAANCDPAMTNAITSAVASTSLGNKVTWSNSGKLWTDTSHPYGVDSFCPDSTTNSIAYTNAASCSSTTSTGTTPGTYVRITVSYTFTPLFRGATIASLFPATISRTTYQRLK